MGRAAAGGARALRGGFGDRRVRLSAGLTAVVVVLSWARPVAEQVGGGSDGNVSRLWQGLREGNQTLDWPSALNLVADVIALPPWWLRPSYRDAVVFGPFGNPEPPLVLSALALAALGALIGWCWWDARRRGDRVAATAVGTAAVLLVTVLVSANQAPAARAGTVAYQMRYRLLDLQERVDDETAVGAPGAAPGVAVSPVLRSVRPAMTGP